MKQLVTSFFLFLLIILHIPGTIYDLHFWLPVIGIHCAVFLRDWAYS